MLESRDNPPNSYTITYSDAPSGRICGSATIPASSCLNGTCCYTFGEISPPCSSNSGVSVTVFATSIVGDGPSSQPLIFSLKTPEHGPGKLCTHIMVLTKLMTIVSFTHEVINIDNGQGCHTNRELISSVASLAITLIIVITVFIITTVKLQRDKENMRRQMSVQSSGILKRDLNQIVDYENIAIDQEVASKLDIENPAYSTVKN